MIPRTKQYSVNVTRHSQDYTLIGRSGRSSAWKYKMHSHYRAKCVMWNIVAEGVCPLDMAQRPYLDNDLRASSCVQLQPPSISSGDSQGRDFEPEGQVVKFICLTVDCSY
jgi:hypothetical protein